MRLIKQADKIVLKMTEQEYREIGVKNGWIKKAQPVINKPAEEVPQEAAQEPASTGSDTFGGGKPTGIQYSQKQAPLSFHKNPHQMLSPAVKPLKSTAKAPAEATMVQPIKR